MRAFLVAAIVLVLAAAGITVALANRDDSGSTDLRSVAKREPSPATQPRPKRVSKPPAKTPPKVPSQPAASNPKRVAPQTLPDFGETPVGPPPVTPTLPAPPPPTPSYPPSSLTWQTTPAALTIKAGGHTVVAVTVINPTDGTVTLGQPLSCPPVLQPNNGGPAIGGGVCAQMAQVMSPLQTLTQQYTIYATTTGDASGAPLPVGRYTARFENLHSMTVTVTAS